MDELEAKRAGNTLIEDNEHSINFHPAGNSAFVRKLPR
jgi:hypothetical protein